jgi:hypothetical protein
MIVNAGTAEKPEVSHPIPTSGLTIVIVWGHDSSGADLNQSAVGISTAIGGPFLYHLLDTSTRLPRPISNGLVGGHGFRLCLLLVRF